MWTRPPIRPRVLLFLLLGFATVIGLYRYSLPSRVGGAVRRWYTAVSNRYVDDPLKRRKLLPVHNVGGLIILHYNSSKFTEQQIRIQKSISKVSNKNSILNNKSRLLKSNGQHSDVNNSKDTATGGHSQINKKTRDKYVKTPYTKPEHNLEVVKLDTEKEVVNSQSDPEADIQRMRSSERKLKVQGNVTSQDPIGKITDRTKDSDGQGSEVKQNKEDENSAKWLETQEKRRRVVKEGCEKTETDAYTLLELVKKRNLLSNLLVDDKHKAIYCYIPKVACTQWKRILMILTGTSKAVNPLKIPHFTAHYFSGLQNLGTAEISGEDILFKLSNYTKFFFVRHPLERLVSAYRDKFESDTKEANTFKNIYGRRFLEFLYPDTDFTAYGDDITLEFWEFCSFLGSHDPSQFQEHWASSFHLCHPCSISYDYIGKFETLEKDSNMILRLLNSPPYLHFPKYVRSKTKSKVKTYLSDLPHPVLKKLVELYKQDFQLFDYSLKDM